MATQTVGTRATYQNVNFEHDGTLAVVTLNRPNRRNALSLELMYELTDCLSAIGRFMPSSWPPREASSAQDTTSGRW